MNQISPNILVTPFALKYQQMLSYSFLIIAAFLFFNIDNDTWIIIKSSIADAYINVTSFVAGTLLIFFFLEKFFNIDLNRLLHSRPKLEDFN